jgi:hypothetical protein
MEIPPPTYTRHLKTSAEFLAGLTQEKLDEWSDLNITYPEQNGDDWSPESVRRLADVRDQAAEALPAIRQRIDALRDALDEGWLPPRVIKNEIDHLHRVLSPYHLSRYLTDALATLQEAEADLAVWQTLSPGARSERWAEWERAEAEAEQRRKQAAEISARQNAFYAAFFAMGISPIPMSAESIAEPAKQLDAIERQISNMRNHLYE